MELNFAILILITGLLSVWIYIRTRGEILSCAFFSLSTHFIAILLLCIVSILYWKIGITIDTILVITLGLFSIIIAELLAQFKYRHKVLNNQPVYKEIRIRYCNILLLIYIVAALLYFRSILQVGASLGFHDLSAIGEVKENMSIGEKMNPIVRQMYKVINAANYIHAFIFAHNVFLVKKSWKGQCKHLLPFITAIFVTFASGGRVDIFKEIVAVIFIFYMVFREAGKWGHLYIYKIAKYAIPLMVTFLIFFHAVSLIVKSNAYERDKSTFFEYIAYYTGSPIQVLNLKLDDNEDRWKYKAFGYQTFSGIYNLFGYEDPKEKSIGSGMIPLGGFSDTGGNAMTLIGRLYFDFGLFGMSIFLFITYYLFARYYYKYILNTYCSCKRNQRLILYAFCYTSIIVLAFYDSCYWIFLSTTGLLTLLILFIMYKIYFKLLLVKK